MQTIRSIFILLALSLGLAGFTGCTTAPVTGRNQLILTSTESELQMGISAFNEMKQEMPVSQDPAANQLLQKVGERIAAASAGDLPNAQWEFVVFESEQANAFCLPGGKVGIYTGILPITKTEAGLATVIGHEVAHAAARHGGERITQSMLLGLGAAGLDLATKNESEQERALYGTAYGLSSSLLYALPHSRRQELEADRVGLTYMAKAGYNPEAAVDFWQRFAEFNAQQGSEVPWFLRTHPLDETRIEQIRNYIPEAKVFYQPQP